MILMLAKVLGVGIETADMLVNEVLWRNLRDERAIGTVRRHDRLAGRKRQQTTREGIGQGRQCPGAAGHGAAGMALAHVPKGKRVDQVVLCTNGRWTARCAQNNDRGFGSQVADRALALRDHRRSAGGRQAAGGGLSSQPSEKLNGTNGGDQIPFGVRSASARCNAKTIRGGGDPTESMASRRGREWARPKEPRRDAHDCIMDRIIEDMSSRSSQPNTRLWRDGRHHGQAQLRSSHALASAERPAPPDSWLSIGAGPSTDAQSKDRATGRRTI